MFGNRLTREVTVVVVIKTAIVLFAAFFVFGARQRPAIDADVVTQHLMAPPIISDSQKETP
jgi:hypothetical protein